MHVEKVVVHRLPFAVDKEATADVSARFFCPDDRAPSTPESADDDGSSTILTTTFRGRKLVGRKVDLPRDVSGVVLNRSDVSNFSDLSACRSAYEITETFEDLYDWDHDDLPPSDPRAANLAGWLEWMDVAAAMHEE